jgi:hypothetical protein
MRSSASGSLPRGVPDDFYVDVARLASRKGAKLVLDTSGEALKVATAHGVFLTYLWRLSNSAQTALDILRHHRSALALLMRHKALLGTSNNDDFSSAAR